jgi:hypothetical protein
MVVLPLCCFPPLSWMATSLQPEVYIDVHEHFEKQTYRSRFDVLAANGKLSLSLSIQSTKGQLTPLRDIRLAPGPWRKNHWTTLRSAYGKAAFFDYLSDDLQTLFLKKELVYLIDFNQRALEIIQPFVKGFHPKYTSAFVEKNEPGLRDFRQHWNRQQQPQNVISYVQVFCDRHPFMPDLSILDLVMNKGPQSADYLRQLTLLSETES